MGLYTPIRLRELRYTVIIPASVTSIGWGAFGYCDDLVAVVNPASVTSIGNRAFFGSGRLRSVYIENPSAT